jgi:hypothetical protein
MSTINRTYNAEPTLKHFHASNKPIRTVRGPVGSGKSVAMAIEILRRASEMPPSSDGVRRSRCVVVRNTLQQLKSTCLVTLQEWLRPITRWKVSDATLYMEFTPADGIPVYCEILMLPLDTPENQQRLLSLEITFAWVSEFREIPLEILQAVYSRLGRYPSRVNIPDGYWYGLWAETNSFSEDSEYFTYLELEKPDIVDYFIQPGGMEPDAENRQNLPARYYDDMIEANTENWVDQYVHNKIGPSLSGQAVFGSIFNRDFHIGEGVLNADTSRPIVIGMDTGRNPAAVVGQIDNRGRMLVLSSIHAENCGMEQFLNEYLRPHLVDRFFGNGKFFISIDPAARQRSQIGEESVFDAVKRLGYSVVLAPTNNISPRLRAVEKYMSRQVGGKAGFLIDPDWNEHLIKALIHDYRYKRSKQGDLSEIPEKGHPESDLADALQYLCLSADSSVLARELARQNPVEKAPRFSKAAWT